MTLPLNCPMQKSWISRIKRQSSQCTQSSILKIATYCRLQCNKKTITITVTEIWKFVIKAESSRRLVLKHILLCQQFAFQTFLFSSSPFQHPTPVLQTEQLSHFLDYIIVEPIASSIYSYDKPCPICQKQSHITYSKDHPR